MIQRALAFENDRTGADMSVDGKYRYRLWRWWGKPPYVLWIMLNPSTADDVVDDPTIRRCVGFTKAWGMGGIEVVNIFALRATDPGELKAADDPIGPRNDEIIGDGLNGPASHRVAAWGVAGGKLAERRAEEIQKRFRFAFPIDCLGMTRSGAPRHPLYLPKTAQIEQWPRSQW